MAKIYATIRIPKFDADKGLPDKAQTPQVGIFEVYAVEDTSFKDRFFQVARD